MHHSLLPKGGQAGPLKQGQARWFPTSKTPSQVFFLKSSKPAKRLKNQDWQRTLEVIEVIRGKVKVDREIKTRRFAVKLNLFIGDVSDTDYLWMSTIIALEYTSLADARAVVNKAIEIQKTIPFKQTAQRRKALIKVLEEGSTDRAAAWLWIFPQWFQDTDLWQPNPSQKLVKQLQRVIEAEVDPNTKIAPADLTAGRNALELMSKPNAPALPVDLLLRCLGRKRSLRNEAAGLLVRTKGDDRQQAIKRMRVLLRYEKETIYHYHILGALGKMKATEALAEIREVYRRAYTSPIRRQAQHALEAIKKGEGQTRLLKEISRTGTFGPAYFVEMAQGAAGKYKSPDFVPYLVEACNGLKLVSYGDGPIIKWLRDITGVNSDDPSAFKKWWTKKFPNEKWPIRKVRIADKLGNLEFIFEP